MALLHQSAMPDITLPRAREASTNLKPESSFFSQRSRRQFALYAAGVGFFGLSVAITRRSIVRRYKAAVPKFYYPNTRPPTIANGALEAFEALNLATLNVLSMGIMVTGGALWALNISSLEDLQRRVKTYRGLDELPKVEDENAEREIEEWFTQVLSRKEFKALRGQVTTEEQLGTTANTAKGKADDEESGSKA